jgi:hypothetical protein
MERATVPFTVYETQDASIAEAVAAERERCATIAEHLSGWGSARNAKSRASELAAHIAKVIRGS